MKSTVKSSFLGGVALVLALSAIPAMAEPTKHELLTICHEGKTKQVPKPALKAHLDHGDTMGPCLPATELRIDTHYQANTGDTDFDDFLLNMNIVAGGRLAVFITDLAASYDVAEKEVKSLIYRNKTQPADAFMILQLAKISDNPFKVVIPQFRTYRAKGWGATTLSYGIKPGSQKFLLLKEDIPPTIREYGEVETEELKGSKGSKGSKGKKGSKGSKGSKGKKGSKGSKGK